MKTILLDSGPVGMLAHRSGLPEIDASKARLKRLMEEGNRVVLPEICDYEVRRELIRIGATKSIERLDRLTQRLEYLPISTAIMRLAATLWAQLRSQGRATAHPHALDGDVILAATAQSLCSTDAVVATANVVHLIITVPAVEWASL